MPTRAQIEALIQSKLSGIAGVTTHADHEDLLFDETNSILNAVYGSVVQEDETTGTITTTGTNFDYDVQIMKVGRRVQINGIAQETSGTIPTDSTIFTLTGGTEYVADTTPMITVLGVEFLAIGQARSFLSGDVFTVALLTDGTLYSMDAVGANEAFFFNITYNTQN